MAEARNTNKETENQSTGVVQNRPRSELSRRQQESSELGSPFAFMRRFVSDMDRLFGDFGFAPADSWLGPRLERSMGGSSWSPQIDISERDGRILIHADLPGMKQDDIHVNVEEGLLTISGQRSDEHEQNQGGVHRRERSYGSFVRRIALPEGVDPESIQASFENGVLEVSMSAPRSSSRGRQIPIQNKPPQGTPPSMSH